MRAKPISLMIAVATPVFLSAGIASAHVVVTPSEVGVAASQTFSMSVPSEEEGIQTTSLRLLVPSGLQDVTPTVIPGWTISTKKDGDAVTEIDWTGGSIPEGQREDFTFRAQAPASSGELDWKAYQTYSNASVVSWDQAPVAGKADDDSLTPYSVTTVVNDLEVSPPAGPVDARARALGTLGIVLSVIAIAVAFLSNKRLR